MQTEQALGAAGVSVEGLGGLGGFSSPVSDTPFLNSFIDFPSEAANSGSFFAPNRKSTIARPTSRSWEPIIAVPPSGSPTPYASAQRIVAQVLARQTSNRSTAQGILPWPRAALVLVDVSADSC
jgi:hypothetical protein